MRTTSSFPSSSRTRDLHRLLAGRRERAAHVVGADGQLAVAAVHEHGELDARRAAEVDELVEGGADGAAGEEHVVHEHHRAAVDREEDVGALGDRLGGQAREVVAVERDVEGAHRGLRPRRLGDEPGEPPGERHAAAADAHEGEALRVRVALEDLVRDAGEGPGHSARVHEGHARQGARMLPRRPPGDKGALPASPASGPQGRSSGSGGRSSRSAPGAAGATARLS